MVVVVEAEVEEVVDEEVEADVVVVDVVVVGIGHVSEYKPQYLHPFALSTNPFCE